MTDAEAAAFADVLAFSAETLRTEGAREWHAWEAPASLGSTILLEQARAYMRGDL